MRAHLIIIFQIRQQQMSEVPLSEHNNVVKAFPSDRTDVDTEPGHSVVTRTTPARAFDLPGLAGYFDIGSQRDLTRPLCSLQ
jgi:hypothetical protein